MRGWKVNLQIREVKTKPSAPPAAFSGGGRWIDLEPEERIGSM
jgi:hypothetical protein